MTPPLPAGIHAAPTSLPDDPPGVWVLVGGEKIAWCRTQHDADTIKAALVAFYAAQAKAAARARATTVPMRRIA